MNRTRRAFDRRFSELLAVLGARDRPKGLCWLLSTAERTANERRVTLSHALAEQNIQLARRVNRLRRRRLLPNPMSASILFCDAGLGGLTRWLRASGCDARWVQDISDADLVNEAERLQACILTTDSLLLDRRPIAAGQVRALWVPPSLTKLEQLRLVRAELDLPESESRCMRCGGELDRVDKESVREIIPPRTYQWVSEYFECMRCGQLFWHGTHWQQVARRLTETALAPAIQASSLRQE